MDEPELTYFVETIRDLERSLRRWRFAAVAALALTLLFLGVVNVVQGYRAAVAMQRARAMEEVAREEVARQRSQAEAAKEQGREPVFGNKSRP